MSNNNNVIVILIIVIWNGVCNVAILMTCESKCSDIQWNIFYRRRIEVWYEVLFWPSWKWCNDPEEKLVLIPSNDNDERNEEMKCLLKKRRNIVVLLLLVYKA